jgi:hypothetical protein
MRNALLPAALLGLALAASPLPRAHAGAASLEAQVQSLPGRAIDYAKRGGKTGKAFKAKRGGPPPWAPAWGRRYRR